MCLLENDSLHIVHTKGFKPEKQKWILDQTFSYFSKINFGLTQGFTPQTSFMQNDLVLKMRTLGSVYNLGLASMAKSAFESHFPNLIITGKQKIYSVKTFYSQQI